MKTGEECLVVEDVVTTGESVLETVRSLRAEGLTVNNAVVVLDRNQGGVANLAREGVKLHSVLLLDEVLAYLVGDGCVGTDMATKVQDFIRTHNMAASLPNPSASLVPLPPTPHLPPPHPLLLELRSIVEQKKSNLALSADVTTSSRLLEVGLGKRTWVGPVLLPPPLPSGQLVDSVRPHVCMYCYLLPSGQLVDIVWDLMCACIATSSSLISWWIVWDLMCAW